MLFSILFYSALLVFVAGTVWRMSAWFTRKVGPDSRRIPASKRMLAALRGTVGMIFSRGILRALWVLFMDGLLQRRILKEDALRWVMHMCIFWGFVLLLLMHALDEWITEKLFDTYWSTANPFLFLRDFFGIVVVAGLCLALYRRFILKVPRLKTRRPDVTAIVVLAVIMVSGFLLQGSKVLSQRDYERMVEEWAGTDDRTDLQALESYWVEEFGLHSPDLEPPFSEETLSQGRELHEMSCSFCHAPPESAFASYGLSRVISPFASFMEGINAALILWHIHILACFIGLAYVPFGKMFHMIATPVGLVVSTLVERRRSDPANTATRQAIELDACTRCGTCSLRCSQLAAGGVIDNPFIFPSERMVALSGMGREGRPDPAEEEAFRQGAYICSNCDRCTVVCPAGINLRDLWLDVREDLIQAGVAEPAVLSPFSFYRGLMRPDLEGKTDYGAPPLRALRAFIENGRADEGSPLTLTGRRDEDVDPVLDSGRFSVCFGCRNCTSVCPVVVNYEDPGDRIGLLPHQIMSCLGLGLVDTASRSKMLWDCATCYQCEEHCPQGVRITEVFYALKNRAAGKMIKGRTE